MNLVIILGPGAVGKMTVGQELAKITGLKLLHNHMFMEVVHNFFDVFSSDEGKRLNTLFKQEIFEAVANSDLAGLIYTAAINFDNPSNVAYINSLIELFEWKNANVCVVELYADFKVRIERNKTENRLLHKPTKRDVQRQERYMHEITTKYKNNTNDGETTIHKNYLKIDNTNLPPDEAALKIKEAFRL